MEAADAAQLGDPSRSTKQTSRERVANEMAQQDKMVPSSTTTALLRIQELLKASKLGEPKTSTSTGRDTSPEDAPVATASEDRKCNLCKAPLQAQLSASNSNSTSNSPDCVICRRIQAIIDNCEQAANLKGQSEREEITTKLAMQQKQEAQRYLSDIDALMSKHQQDMAMAEANARQILEALAFTESTVYTLQEQLDEATAPKDDNAYWLQADTHRAQMDYMQKEMAALQKQAGDRVREQQIANSMILKKHNANETERKKLYHEFKKYRDETDERIASLTEQNDILRREKEEALAQLDAYHQLNNEDTKKLKGERAFDLSEPDKQTVSEPLEPSDPNTVSPRYLGMIAELNDLRVRYEAAAEGLNITNEEMRWRRAELDELQMTLNHAN